MSQIDEMISKWSEANEANLAKSQESAEVQAQEAAPTNEVQDTPAQPVVEQPTAEVPTTQVEEPQTVPQENIEEKVQGFLKDKYGIESLDVLSEINKPREPQVELPDTVKPILDFVKETGRSAEDWFYFQSLDPTKLTPEQKVFIGYQIKYPDLSNEDIKDILDTEFTLDEDTYSEREVKAAKTKMKIAALEAESKINEYRSKFTAVEKPASQAQEEQFLTAEEKSAIKQRLNDFNSIKIDLPEGKSVSYQIDQPYKQQLLSQIDKVEDALLPYVKQDGSFDGQLFAQHRTIVDNFQKIVAQTFSQGLTEGLNQVKNARSNIQLDPKAELPTQQKDAQVQHMIAEWNRINGR